jgi:hypothetical protein
MITVEFNIEECLRIISVAGHDALVDIIQPALDLFEQHGKAVILASATCKHVPLDSYGRSYTVVKREESASSRDCILTRAVGEHGAVALARAWWTALHHPKLGGWLYRIHRALSER